MNPYNPAFYIKVKHPFRVKILTPHSYETRVIIQSVWQVLRPRHPNVKHYCPGLLPR